MTRPRAEGLNKGLTVAQNLAAVATLKRLGLMYEFGFMMFDPSSSFAAIRDNVRFLDAITSDGSAAAVFCRMLPYDGTPIKDELAAAGRLRGDASSPDYAFLDDRIESFYETLNRLMNVTGWIHGYRALSPQLNWAWNELAIARRLLGAGGIEPYERRLREITRASNRVLLDTVVDLADVFEHGAPARLNAAALPELATRFLRELLAARARRTARRPGRGRYL